MEWLDAFIATQRAWFSDAALHGVPATLLEFGERQLVALEQARARSEVRAFGTHQAAEARGVHPETVRRYARRGVFGPVQPGKHLTLSASDIKKLPLRKRSVDSNVRSLVDRFRPEE